MNLDEIKSYWADVLEGKQLLEGGESFDSMNYVYSTSKLKYPLLEIKAALLALASANPEAKDVAKVAFGELCYFRSDVEDKEPIKTGEVNYVEMYDAGKLLESGADILDIAKKIAGGSESEGYQFNIADETEKLHKEFELCFK